MNRLDSILGRFRTLFAAFIDDLSCHLKDKCKLYADDFKLKFNIARVESEVDIRTLSDIDDIDMVARWCQKWFMELNTEKCKVMNIGGNKLVGRSYSLSSKKGLVKSKTYHKRTRFGSIITPDFNFSAQAAHAAAQPTPC